MDLLARAARRLGVRRPRPAAEPEPEPTSAVDLDDVRRRLELLLAAVYGQPIPIAAAEPPPQPGWVKRILRPTPRHLRDPHPIPSSDGERILLPPSLAVGGDGPAAALARYRLLAVGQAERLHRGTAEHVPGGDAPLERDLYLLAESAAVDAAIARAVPGVVPALVAERAAALARRPALDSLTSAEREVEIYLRRLLSAPPADAPADLARLAEPESTPAESLAWARETAARLRESVAAARYRGVPHAAPWGVVLPLPPGAVPLRIAREESRIASSSAGENGREAGESENPSNAPAGQSDAANGLSTPTGDEPLTPRGEADPWGGGRSDGDPADGGEGVDGGKGMDGGEGKDCGGSDNGGEPKVAAFVPRAKEAKPAAEAVDYPEWDYRAGRYFRPGATVRPFPCADGDPEWSAEVLRRHGGLVRRLREQFERLREQFERLRARRARLRQQKDGEELDLAACVRALVDRRAGHAVDDRLYESVRPARREIAITLLVDVSGSTSDPVNATGLRIIDVEKTALLLIGEAFDALGDRYAVLTFSGRGAGNVRMRTVKDFDEPGGERIRRRVAALQPEGFTRLGAAVRHASALLASQGTSHRLLLILSDGKPWDEDHYGSLFGVEDARQAIAEARARGVYPFCVTVDREASAYLPRIFGRAGHMILRDPEQLPMALVRVVRQILRSG